jgi:hypothetical protein
LFAVDFAGGFAPFRAALVSTRAAAVKCGFAEEMSGKTRRGG